MQRQRYAAENLFQVCLRSFRIVLQVSVRIHDKPRRAEAALSAIVHRNAILRRIKTVVNVANAFGGCERVSVE